MPTHASTNSPFLQGKESAGDGFGDAEEKLDL